MRGGGLARGREEARAHALGFTALPPPPPSLPALGRTIFANERTFLRWLSVTLLVVSHCLALLAFDSPAARATALLLGPPCVAFLLYALARYHYRAFLIRTGASGGYHDRFGPAFLTLVVVCALITNHPNHPSPITLTIHHQSP